MRWRAGIRFVAVLAVPAALLGVARGSAALDTGPKPSMDFSFVYDTPERVPIESGQLLECEDARCRKSHPLEEGGPQRFACTKYECSARAYGFADHHRLVLHFADRVRRSNIFRTGAFDSKYVVTVRPDDLVVKVSASDEAAARPFGDFLLALLLTLVVEGAVGAVYLGLARRLGSVVWLLLGSLVTLPFVWYVAPLLGLGSVATLAVGESGAVVVEALLLFFASRKRVGLPHAIAVSVLANGASFVLGIVLGWP